MSFLVPSFNTGGTRSRAQLGNGQQTNIASSLQTLGSSDGLTQLLKAEGTNLIQVLLTSAEGNNGTVSMTGTTGPTGPAGSTSSLTGPTGPRGPTGPTGTATIGPDGPRGVTGPTGPRGMGVTGPAGPAGPTGPRGSTGPSGITSLETTNVNNFAVWGDTVGRTIGNANAIINIDSNGYLNTPLLASRNTIAYGWGCFSGATNGNYFFGEQSGRGLDGNSSPSTNIQNNIFVNGGIGITTSDTSAVFTNNLCIGKLSMTWGTSQVVLRNKIAVGYNAQATILTNDSAASYGIGYHALAYGIGYQAKGASGLSIGCSLNQSFFNAPVLAIGFNATGAGCISLGNSAGGGTASALYTIRNLAFVLPGSTQMALNTSTGQFGRLNSSIRYKKNIQPLAFDTSKIFNLTPKSFDFKKELLDCPRSFGLIAEEVYEQIPSLVPMKNGEPHSVHYHLLSVVLLNELKQLLSDIHNRHDAIANQVETTNLLQSVVLSQLEEIYQQDAMISSLQAKNKEYLSLINTLQLQNSSSDLVIENLKQESAKLVSSLTTLSSKI